MACSIDFLQIGGDDILPAIGFQIVVQRVEEIGVAQLLAQHFQHPAAFGVDVAGVLDGIVEIAIDDRHGIHALLAEPLVLVAPEFVGGIIRAVVLLDPVVLEESGEAFVEPEIGPILARDQIAEPLMSQFVRIHDRRSPCAIPAPERGSRSSRAVSVVALVFSMPPSTKSSTEVCAYCAQG